MGYLMVGQTDGLVRVVSNATLIAQEKAQEAEVAARQAEPVILGLAGHVRHCFNAANTARQTHEQDMMSALRARAGQYDPAILTEIQKQGGSQVYMRVTATKMRGAQSWLKDIYLNIERPWTIDPTPKPALKDDIAPLVEQQLDVMATMAAMQGVAPQPGELEKAREQLTDKANAEVLERARQMADRAALKIDDKLVEGGFYKALDEALTDITTFKLCCIKGPVVRMKKRLAWTQAPTGERVPTVALEPIYTFSRVSPLAIYPAPNAVSVNDGYIIQRHKFFRADLVELIDSPGFDSTAIRAVLEQHGQGGLNEWLSVDSQEQVAINGGNYTQNNTGSPTIEALEYWGTVSGKMLLDWGMSTAQVTDPTMEYPCNVWVIGQYVIKAMLNADPLGRVPFSATSLVKIPGTIWGEGLSEQLYDIQQVCNAAARSLVNNMAIASGPMVGVDASRLPPGETITSLHPWKIFQFVRDLVGSSNKPIEFFQPQSNASELHGVYEKFSTLADEYSSIPRYMLGDNSVGGAGRTAAGLSMLMNAANKGIKNIANNIDTDMIVPTVERLYFSLMLNDDDETLKGDLQIRAKGASGLMLKELLNQRRIEFMQQVPAMMEMGIVKPEGVAALLREVVKGLDMPQDRIVPSDEEIKMMQMMRAQQEAAAAAAQAESQEDNVEFKRDASGATTGATVKPKRPRTQDQELRSLST